MITDCQFFLKPTAGVDKLLLVGTAVPYVQIEKSEQKVSLDCWLASNRPSMIEVLTSLIMLDPHSSLSWPIHTSKSICCKDWSPLKIGQVNNNLLRWLFLESKQSVPGHVLNSKQSTIVDNLIIIISVCN